MTRERMLEFLNRELIESRRSLAAREDMARTWRSGTNKEWSDIAAETGQRKPPAKGERLRLAERDDRIAARYRADIETLEALAEMVKEGM